MDLNSCSNSPSSVQIIQNNNQQKSEFKLSKTILNQTNFNCVLKPNQANGLIELITTRDIQMNEDLLCWFSQDYLASIQSKIFLNFIFFPMKSQ